MLFFGLQVIAVILAVFIRHGNGRAITSTSNDNIERMLDLAEEEFNTVVNETNERITEREEENAADVLRSSEEDSLSVEALQFPFGQGNIIQPKETRPVLRQKRSHTGPCYTGNYQMVPLASGGPNDKFPICKNVTSTGCGSSIKKYSTRKCVGSDYKAVRVLLATGASETRVFPQKCSCAV